MLLILCLNWLFLVLPSLVSDVCGLAVKEPDFLLFLFDPIYSYYFYEYYEYYDFYCYHYFAPLF